MAGFGDFAARRIRADKQPGHAGGSAVCPKGCAGPGGGRADHLGDVDDPDAEESAIDIEELVIECGRPVHNGEKCWN